MSALVKHKISDLALLFFSLVIMLGCGPIRIISPYDQVIDEGVTKFHTDVTSFVGKMVTLAGKPEGTYESNKGSYSELAAEVGSLRMRAAQTPKNDITVKSLDEIAGNVERLRQLHESGKEQGLSKPLADPALVALTVQCESIIKFEIAKKRGEDETK